MRDTHYWDDMVEFQRLTDIYRWTVGLHNMGVPFTFENYKTKGYEILQELTGKDLRGILKISYDN